MDIRALIDELETYASARNVVPGTVCREAGLGFSLHGRLLRRELQLEKDAARLREYMASHPVVVQRPEAAE